MSYLLGDYLGGVARICRAVSCGEPNVGKICREDFFYYVETIYGHGFIDTVLSTFPELQRTNGLRNRMQQVIDLSFDEAMRITEQSVSALEVLCKCFSCKYEHVAGDMSVDPSRGCIIGLAYTIRKIASSMAYTVQVPDGPQLLPAVQGILKLSTYGNLSNSTEYRLQESEIPLEDEAPKSVWNTTKFYWNALGLRHVQQPHEAVVHRHPSILSTASALFSGSEHRERLTFEDVRSYTAISQRGVCCFIDALRSISYQADTLCRIHVFAGHIQYKNRPYEFVYDGNIPWEKAWTWADKDPARIEVSLDSIPDAINTKPDIAKIQALATEASSGTSISCYYRVSTSKPSVLISPGNITRCVLDRSSLISCHRRSCHRHLALPCSVV